MSRVITFSRTFPSYHPKAGQPTYFVEKTWTSLLMFCNGYFNLNDPRLEHEIRNYYSKIAVEPKHHTIRAGHRWKAGDWFSPRVWSGKPYNSKQIQFAPDIEIKKVWDFQIVKERDGILTWYNMTLNGQIFHNQYHTSDEIWTNDGLAYNDFCDWFKMDKAKKEVHFDGQIICWSENINY